MANQVSEIINIQFKAEADTAQREVKKLYEDIKFLSENLKEFSKDESSQFIDKLSSRFKDLGNVINGIKFRFDGADEYERRMSEFGRATDLLNSSLKELTISNEAFNNEINTSSKSSGNALLELSNYVKQLKYDFNTFNEDRKQGLFNTETVTRTCDAFRTELENVQNKLVEIKEIGGDTKIFQGIENSIDSLVRGIGAAEFNTLSENLRTASEEIIRYQKVVESNRNAINSMSQSIEAIEFERLEKGIEKLTEESIKYENAVNNNKVAVEKMREAHQTQELEHFEKELNKLTESYNNYKNAVEANKEAIDKMKIAQQEHEYARFEKELMNMTNTTDNLSDAVHNLFNNSSFKQTKEEREAIEKENEARKKNWEEVYKQAEAIGKLNEERRKASTPADSGFKNETNGEVKSDKNKDKINNNVENIAKLNVNSEILINTLGNLASTGNVSASTFTSLAKAIGMSGAELAGVGAIASVSIAAIKKYIDEIEKAEQTLLKIGETLGDGVVGAIKFTVDSIETLKDACMGAYDTLKDFAEIGAEVEDAYFRMSALVGGEATENLVAFTEQLQEIQGVSATELTKTFSDITAATASMGIAGDDLESVGKSLLVISEDLSIFAGSVEKASSDLNNAISKGYIGRASSLYKIFTKNELVEFKALNSELERYNYIMKNADRIHNNYMAYLNTSSGKVALLNMQIAELKNNVGTIALSLYSIVAPILTNIIKIANVAITSIIKLFNIKETSFNLDSVADKISASMDKVGDSAEKASRKAASFDDVIQISDNKSGSSGFGDIDYDALNAELEKILSNEDKVRTEWDDLMDKIKEDIARGDFNKLGSDIADFFADKLGSINWEEIQRNLHKTGFSIAEFINGLTSNKDNWTVYGDSLAQGLNSIINLLHGFVKELDFGQLGEAFGTMWSGFWSNINTNKLGESIALTIKGAFQFVAGWLSQGGFTEMFSAIADTIVAGLNNISDEDIVNGVGILGDLISNFLGSASDTVGTLKENGFFDKLKLVFKSLIDEFAKNSGEWGKDLNEIISPFFDVITETLEDPENIGKIIIGITNFLTKLDIGKLLTDILETQIFVWGISLFTKVFTFADTKFAILKRIFKIFGSDILAGFGGLIRNILEALSKKFPKITEKVKKGVKGIINSLADLINKWLGDSAVGKILTKINIIPKEGFNIPKLATGGIATRSTIANIGEAGKEAVLPLERNTGWMDTLANKIAVQIGGNNNQGSVTLDMSRVTGGYMSRADKLQFAETVVDSLRLRGANVAIV